MSYLKLLYVVSSIVSITFSALWEPEVVDIVSKTSYHFSIEYCEFSVAPYITTMNAHCYCFFDLRNDVSYNCSIPGPTLIFHPSDMISITWHNRLTGTNSSEYSYFNEFRDLDITNIHTHGLHIDPDEDDTYIRISPGESNTFIFKIPDDHYPGTHWLHAHHHGSASWQVTSGLFSALLMEYGEKDSRIYDLDELLATMDENILLFHGYFVIETSLCDCDADEWQTYFYYPPAFELEECITGKNCYPILSHCYQYCSMPAAQRSLSGFTYKMESDYLDYFQLFLVNGQYEPVINDLKVNTFRRLRLINALSQYYIQYKFPTIACFWYIIAIDGIYLNDSEVRSINEAPYFGEYLLPAGGRLDVIVKCSKKGVYTIITTESNDNDPDLENIVRVPAENILFRISVSNVDGLDDDYDDSDTTPSIEYPSRPEYLTDLLSASTNLCGCNTYFTDNTTSVVIWEEAECGLVFNMKNYPNINGVQYDPSTPLTYLEYENVYEFIFIPHKHVYHQHTFPFQLVDAIGYNGFQAHAGDWFDTLGGPKFNQYRFRMKPIDYVGVLEVESHVLTHADLGMRGYYQILNPTKICDILSGEIIPAPTMYPTLTPSFEPTEDPTSIPTTEPTPRPSLSPTSAPTPICPLTEENEVDFILLYDNSCGLSDWNCDELLYGAANIIMSLMNDTIGTRIQTMQYIAKGAPLVVVDFDDIDLQNNPAIYAEYVRRKGDCTAGGGNKADLLHALHDVELYFAFLNDDKLHKVILLNGCKDYSDDICDIIAPDYETLAIDTYVVNFVNASYAEHVITPLDNGNYLSCLTQNDPNRMCVGGDDAGISASEFAWIINECLLPEICYPPEPTYTTTADPSYTTTAHPSYTTTAEPNVLPTLEPVYATNSPTEYTTDECSIGDLCAQTQDCCTGDIDEGELGITCSCYTKYNVDENGDIVWDSDAKRCCILKGSDGCEIDEDCCKLKTICADGTCTLNEAVDDTTISPTEYTADCSIGALCVETEDCCASDVDERELGITCSSYTKYNTDEDGDIAWDDDKNYCCILKGYDGCETDEDCCKLKTVCSDGTCSNK